MNALRTERFFLIGMTQLYLLLVISDASRSGRFGYGRSLREMVSPFSCQTPEHGVRQHSLFIQSAC